MQDLSCISGDIRENEERLNEVFHGCSDVVIKSFTHNEDGLLVVYIDGLTDHELIEESAIKPFCRGGDIEIADYSEEEDMNNVIHSVLKGDTALFYKGKSKATVVSSKSLPLRSVGENDIEMGIRGPRDSFLESFRKNTSLIRRRIKDPCLKLKQGTVGRRSRTDYGLMYIEGIVNESLVQDIEPRLEKYEIDGIFDSGMAEHLMDDGGIFPVFQATTRPDKVASSIMEGRVAIVFDNSPEVLLAPADIGVMFQGADDYYNSWVVGSFSRIIRYIAAFIAITLPGLYVALTTFHSEMLPTRLLFAIVSARSMVTLPIVVEMLVMEILFEFLREAGIRLPGPLGNTIGIVGGLIVGQAAVDAGIVSTIVIIVVALGAIATFAIPNEGFASVFRLLKFYILLLSAFFGLFGLMAGLISIGIYFGNLESFGQPYLYPAVGSGGACEVKDFIIRSPIDEMKKRPVWADRGNRVRLRRNGGGSNGR